MILLYCKSSFSQEILIGGVPGNRPLTWDDFTGRPDNGSSHEAYTFWNINYVYAGTKYKSDTAVLIGTNVKLELNGTASWIKKGKETNDLLKHEQGHLDIGRLSAIALQQAFNNTVFFKNDLQTKLSAVFAEVFKKYKDMGQLYDDETAHSRNKEEQERGDLFFSKELTKK